MQRRTKPRLLLSVVIALALGVVTTLVVALACSRISPKGLVRRYSVAGRVASATGKPPDLLLVVHRSRPGIATWSAQFPLDEANLTSTATRGDPESHLWGSARTSTIPWLDGNLPWPQKQTEVIVLASGWPLPALYARCWWSPRPLRWDRIIDRNGQTPSANVIPLFPNFIPGIPTGVLWDRFAIDAALYALLWWLLCFAPGIFRFIHRTRYGLCLNCAYDLRANAPNAPCPECGTDPHPSTFTLPASPTSPERAASSPRL